jgi:hypothetical protein
MRKFDPEDPDKCERCGSTENVRTGLDPFAQDVHNEEIEVTWCDDCFYQSAMDI